MKAMFKFSLALLAVAPVAYADNQQMWNYLQQERQMAENAAKARVTVAPYSRGQGVGRHQVIREAQTRDRFEVTQDPHGNYRTFYRSTVEHPNG